MIAPADTTLRALADLAECSLPSGLGRDGQLDHAGAPARAAATAATLRQWAAWARGLPLEMSDLAYAYPILGGRLSHDPPTRSRRHTCRQLGALADQIAGEFPGTGGEAHSALLRVIAVWIRVGEAQDQSDPRQVAIARRCAEEVEILAGRDGLEMTATTP